MRPGLPRNENPPEAPGRKYSPWRNPWLWAVLFGLGCSFMAFGLNWKRGPHHDDYFLYSWSFPRLLDLLRVEVRPVGKLFGALIFSQPEVVARLFGAAMLAGTSLLSGLLIYRVTGIRLAAISVIFLCLLPFAGAEAATWTNALIHFMPAGFFAVLALNLFLSALRSAGQALRGSLLALFSGVSLVLALGSIEPAANFYILFLGLFMTEIYRHPENSRQKLRVLVLATLVIALLSALIYVVFYVDASQVARRGAFEIPSAGRVGSFLVGFLLRGIGGPFGQEVIRISFREGWVFLLGDWTAALLASGTLAAAVALNLSWKTETIPAGRKRSLFAGPGIMMAACLATTLASMLFPSVLLSGENGSPRLAYLPGISGVLFTGCLIAWVMVTLGAKVLQRIILTLVTAVSLVFSVYLLGYTRLYQLRSVYDKIQLEALRRAVPAEAVSGRGITFLPYEVHEKFLGDATSMNQKFLLIGGFSSPNSIGTILEQSYPQTRIRVIRPGYGDFAWGIVPGKGGKGRSLILSGYEADPPQEVRPKDLLLFRFREDTKVELAGMIQFTGDTGEVIDSVTLPTARRLREDYGTPTFLLVCPARAGQLRQTSYDGHAGGPCRISALNDPDTAPEQYSGAAEEEMGDLRDNPFCELVDGLPGDLKRPITVNYGNKVSLLGVTTARLPEDRLRMTYYWRQADGLGAYDTVFVHFTGDRDKMLFQGDHPFCEKRPFKALRGRVIKETQFIDLPPGTAGTGRGVSVRIGLYDASSKSYDRLKIESAAGAATDENNTRAVAGKLRL